MRDYQINDYTNLVEMLLQFFVGQINAKLLKTAQKKSIIITKERAPKSKLNKLARVVIKAIHLNVNSTPKVL